MNHMQYKYLTFNMFRSIMAKTSESPTNTLDTGLMYDLLVEMGLWGLASNYNVNAYDIIHNACQT